MMTNPTTGRLRRSPCACSQDFRTPSHLRQLTERIDKRLRCDIRRAQDANLAEQIVGTGCVRGSA
jgi:hypothetical protein